MWYGCNFRVDLLRVVFFTHVIYRMPIEQIYKLISKHTCIQLDIPNYDMDKDTDILSFLILFAKSYIYD